MKTTKKAILVAMLLTAACTGNQPADNAAKVFEDLKAKPAAKEITAELIASLKDSELEQTIFDNLESQMSADGRDISEKIKTLSKGQRAIYVSWITEAEVEEKGLVGFYAGSGKFLADYVVEAFQTIGSKSFVDLMQQADEIYRAQQNNPSAKDPFDKLEDQFDKLYHEESLDQLKVDYIRKNPTDFISEKLKTKS